MRMDLSTNDFVYAGVPCPGFPLLSDDDLTPLEPFHSFLVEDLLDVGRPLKALTWEAYGRRIWDYASFLRAHNIDWRPGGESAGQGPVVRYRDWSRSDGQSVAISTLNDRLSVVVRFYEWALKTGRITKLPFKRSEVRLRGDMDSYEFIQSQGALARLKPRESPPPLAFLTKPQVAVVRTAHLGPTRKLMFEMGARTGMRSSEIRTFPLSYVFNPTEKCSWLDPSGMVRIALNPSDMELKFDKGRTIALPASLMREMHGYASFYRPGLSRGKEAGTLLLTARGRPFDKDAVVDAFSAISSIVGFRVHAHILRHTFAVHFLLRARSAPDYVGDPLGELMNQLGHASLKSVLVYLKHIGQASVAASLALQRHFDDIFAD